MTQLRSHYPAITAAGAEAVLITFFPPDRTANWARGHKLPFKLASDVSRETYGRYGLGDLKLMDVVGPQSAIAGLKATFSLRQLPYQTINPLQQGGYFVVDREGTLLYAYPSKNPGDHPDPQELLRALGVQD